MLRPNRSHFWPIRSQRPLTEIVYKAMQLYTHTHSLSITHLMLIHSRRLMASTNLGLLYFCFLKTCVECRLTSSTLQGSEGVFPGTACNATCGWSWTKLTLFLTDVRFLGWGHGDTKECRHSRMAVGVSPAEGIDRLKQPARPVRWDYHSMQPF